jgi:hypothetical protein
MITYDFVRVTELPSKSDFSTMLSTSSKGSMMSTFKFEIRIFERAILKGTKIVDLYELLKTCG